MSGSIRGLFNIPKITTTLQNSPNASDTSIQVSVGDALNFSQSKGQIYSPFNIIIGYGSTEAGAEATFTEPGDDFEKIAKGYVGKALPGMEIKTNIGEIIGLFINEEIHTQDKDFFKIVEKIKENNGLVVIPHPFDFLRDNRLKLNLLSEDIIKK